MITDVKVIHALLPAFGNPRVGFTGTRHGLSMQQHRTLLDAQDFSHMYQHADEWQVSNLLTLAGLL